MILKKWRRLFKKEEPAPLVVVGHLSSYTAIDNYEKFLRGKMTLQEYRRSKSKTVRVPIYLDRKTGRLV